MMSCFKILMCDVYVLCVLAARIVLSAASKTLSAGVGQASSDGNKVPSNSNNVVESKTSGSPPKGDNNAGEWKKQRNQRKKERTCKKCGEPFNACKCKDKPRGQKKADLVEDQINHEKDKYEAPKPTPPPKEPFVPDYMVQNEIKVCDITDLSVFAILADMHVDQHAQQMFDAINNFALPKFKPLKLNWETILNDLSPLKWNTDKCPPDVETDEYGFTIIRTTPIWENNSEGVKTKVSEDPRPYVRSWGNFDSFVTNVACQVGDVLEPIVEICNPINYIKLAIRSSQVLETELVATLEGSVSYSDTRSTDLREYQPLIKDTIYRYRYRVVSRFGDNKWMTYPAQYFADISGPRPNAFNRLFYGHKEPCYLYIDLSLNMLSELYHAKTCAANDPNESLITMNRLFKTNPHNTFMSGALAGDRVLEDNYVFGLRFCQNRYRPIAEAPKVK